MSVPRVYDSVSLGWGFDNQISNELSGMLVLLVPGLPLSNNSFGRPSLDTLPVPLPTGEESLGLRANPPCS